MGALLAVPGLMCTAAMAPLLYASAFCCCACQALNCACTFFSCCCQANTSINYKAAKVFYIIMLGLSTLLAFILKFTRESWADTLGPFAFSIGCVNTSFKPGYNYSSYGAEAQAYCVGDAAVYRIGLSLSLFYLFMLGVGSLGEGFFKGYWGFKVITYGGTMVGCFFIPESFFSNGIYQDIARFASAIFLVLQILIFIDFGYTWNEQWVANAYKDSASDTPTNKGWLVLILVCAFLIYALSISVMVVLYIFYGGSCQIPQTLISVSLTLVVIGTILALFRKAIVGEEGAVLPSAVVAIYVFYLTWAALQSDPDQTCKPPANETTSTIVVGIFVAACSLMWTSFNATGETKQLLRGADKVESGAITSPASDPTSGLYRVDEDGKEKMAADIEKNQTPKESAISMKEGEGEGKTASQAGESILLFFSLMVVAALYMSMILTNWGEVSSDINGQTGEASMWVKGVSAWVSALLYIWTLIAPCACRRFRTFD